MESGKLDIDSEVKGPKELVATYKSIPEDDFVVDDKEAKMAKQNGDTDIDDGAQERMLKDTGKINSNKDATEVKFIAENGDAKIDIETVKNTLTGMSKEELMKFANDPFWIRLRWFMFIAFWLLWAGMLAGAIAIIVMAPKCTAPEPKKLWEESPIVRLDPSLTPGGLKALIPILNKLKSKNIKAISIAPIMKISEDGSTIDFKDIRPEFGTIEEFKELVKTAGANNQEIILEVDPNHTSDKHYWFLQSIQKADNYTDYYVWADNKIDVGKRMPPNNWLSVYNGSAWEWNDFRKQYYLHQFHKSQPDLNYANPAVIEEFSKVLDHWLKLGATGFRLANSQYLMESLSRGNESASAQPADPESYNSLVHVYTKDLIENANLLRQWRQMVSNHTKNNGLFTLQEDIKNDTLAVFNDNSTLIDLPQKSHFLFNADANITASAIQAGINNSLPTASAWPAWNLNGQKYPLEDRMPADVAESLTLMTLLLPGTPILSLNQTGYQVEAFTVLTEARSEPVFQYGDTKTNVLNETVFVYTRLKSGNPGYLVAYQSGNETATVDLSKLDQVSEEVNVIAHSSNYYEKGITVKSRVPSDKVPISPKSTLVLQFAPKV